MTPKIIQMVSAVAIWRNKLVPNLFSVFGTYSSSFSVKTASAVVIWQKNLAPNWFSVFRTYLPSFFVISLGPKTCFSYLQGQRLRGLYPDIPAFYLAERPSQRTRGHGRSWADLFSSHAQNLRWTRKVISNEYIDIRYRPRFFDPVGHQTKYASMGNKHFISK